MNLFGSWLASPLPDAAIELSAQHVSVAKIAARGGGYSVEGGGLVALAEGAVVPSLTSQNIPVPSAVVEALESALEQAGGRPNRVALVVPDLACKVSLVRFDQVPSNRRDLDQLIRWQVRKSMPFAVEDACVTYSAGVQGAEGSEFVVAVARKDVVEEYEGICDRVGAHAGLVDLSTLSVVNLFLGSRAVPEGDWLVVHMRPDYTSLAIMGGEDLIFFRSRPDNDGELLTDLVYQTAMYYQDRLGGEQFASVFLGGMGRTPESLDAARGSIEARVGVAVEAIDPTRTVSVTDRIDPMLSQRDLLAPLVGVLVRNERAASV